jgi:diketogulonate reductase-like aldo/keto reductase
MRGTQNVALKTNLRAVLIAQFFYRQRTFMAVFPSDTFTLNSGAAIPRLGLGVFKARSGNETYHAVRSALDNGYRHIDTAAIYGNEADVGRAISDCGIPRDEIFVTTKLWNTDQGYQSALTAAAASCQRLNLEYVDLYLLHWPLPERRLESWRALERLYADRSARSIGVSNFMARHLAELLSYCEVVPAVNQIEMSPFLQQREVRALCAQRQIVIEAYSPLTKGTRLAHPEIHDCARAAKRTPAQILLRWALQSNAVVLPKSVQTLRIIENASIFDFELDRTLMARLDALEEGLVTGWDPRSVE